MQQGLDPAFGVFDAELPGHPGQDLAGVAEAALGDLGPEPFELLPGKVPGVASVVQGAEFVETLIAAKAAEVMGRSG